MLSKADYNLRKSALKRQYHEALQSVDTSALMENPFVAEGIQRMEAKKALRGRGLYEGRGAYSGMKFVKDLRQAGRVLGTNKVTTGLMNRLVGSGMYSGRGSYESSNELMSGSDMHSVSMSSVGDETGSIIISNREYVGDMYGPATTGTFNLTSFPLNPGLEQTFPWLSQIAANYEEYEFMQLVFDFKSSIQDVNSSNGQVGTVIAATNYNASQPVFTDKPSMAAYYGSQSSKTTDDLVHGIECDPNKLSGAVGQYVRVNPVLVGESLKEYDHGLFQLATHNIPTSMLNGTLGELYVTYKVLLRKPKFLTGRGLAITRAAFVSSGSETYLAPFGSGSNTGSTDTLTLLRGQQNNLKVGIDLSVSQKVKIVFPAYFAGNIALTFNVEGSGLVGGLFQIPTGFANSPVLTGQVSKVSDIYAATLTAGDGPEWAAGVDATVGALVVLHLRIQPSTNATDNSITLSVNYTAGTITQAAIDICEYNSSFNGSNGAITLIDKSGTVVVPQ